MDDKLAFAAMCRRVGVPVPETYAVVATPSDLALLPAVLEALPDAVLKPTRGAGGRGVVVLAGRTPDGRWRSAGRLLSLDDLVHYASDVLAGRHSLGGRPDALVVQRRLRTHPAFARISPHGVPDVRVLAYRGEPAMAMLRLPTLDSGGRANLHQGGLGVGVDLATGRTFRAVRGDEPLDRHPDTGEPLLDRAVPFWDAVLALSRTVARATGLGYVGVDVVIDADAGPVVLEANARPGLAIQLANGAGLLPALATIDERPG